jgi:hypothetical protein
MLTYSTSPLYINFIYFVFVMHKHVQRELFSQKREFQQWIVFQVILKYEQELSCMLYLQFVGQINVFVIFKSMA